MSAVASVRDLAQASRPQVTVLAAQALAGTGNLIFSVALARTLTPAAYGPTVAFLALYLLVHVPGSALNAAGALAPERLAGLTRRIALGGAVVGLATAAAAPVLAAASGLPTSLVVVLAAALPGAGLLGLHRGLAYGQEDHGRIVRSLLAEPIVRVLAGVLAAVALGPVGGAAATVVAGYAALAVCCPEILDVLRGRVRFSTAPEVRPSRMSGAVTAAAAAFVVIAVLQAIDVLVANRVLAPDDAAAFGVLSTIGGAAVFATATVPFVAMPAIARARPHAELTADVLTVVVGVGCAVVGGLLARPLVELGFGERYAGIADLVGPYLLAMALVGVARVRVANAAAAGRAAWSLVVLVAGVVVESALIALTASRVEHVVIATLFTAAGVVVALEAPRLVRRVEPGVVAIAGRRAGVPAVGAMVGLCLLALVVRVATSRGLWVDEAISVRQAQLPFAAMLSDVAANDVHPPLHHALLWLTVRIAGTSETAVRLPSLLAGVALVPVLAWVGRVLFDRRTGWVAAALGTIAPFCVWYSQEARMYALFMTLAAVAIGAQVQALRRGERRDWILLGLVVAALVWTQYFALLPVLVHAAATGWALWRDRAAPGLLRARLRGLAIATAIVVVAVLPLLPILLEQLAAYGERGAGLVPGQAGASSSSFGGSISIYAVGANLIWAVVGYHADGVMEQIAALWPLLMLLALVLLGRGRSRSSVLLAALVVVPMAALFAIGSLKRDLFELRYFSGAVPAVLLLLARLVTSTTQRRAAVTLAGAAAAGLMAIGLVDQQVNGANPRLYDFEGALGEVARTAVAGDVLLYEPSYLAEVLDYYAPDLDARPAGSGVPATGTVYVLATERVLDSEVTSARLGTVLAELEEDRRLVGRAEHPNVTVWRLAP